MEKGKDLKVRTKKFAVSVALFCEQLQNRRALNVYSNQLLRASSSVGANYRAACRAKSPADFINKLKIVEEELDESMFFLELIQEFDSSYKELIEKLYPEANELLAIIVASLKTARENYTKQKQSASAHSSFVNRHS